MAIRQSTGLRNFLAAIGAYKRAFQGGVLKIYSGAQPTSPDSAVSGTLLCTLSLASGARTNGVRNTHVMTISGGSGNISAIKINSVDILESTVTFTSDLTTTAALVAAQINACQSVPKYTATSSGAVVTVKDAPGVGTGSNAFTYAYTASTLTMTQVNSAAGVAQVNGLTFGTTTTGVLSKGTGVWSGVNAAGGSAGCFRLIGEEVDANGTSTELIRLDGSISTSGADLNLASTTLTLGATLTIDQFDITVPAS